jgi:GPI mannosyltransferase 1 subunit M
VDYVVFTDAARHVLRPLFDPDPSASAIGDGVAAAWWHLGSPFDRATYRYTPWLAWLVLPNVFVHQAWGKVLFSLVDVLVGWLILRILRARGVPLSSATVYASLYWFNPIAINIATRGSADCIPVALSLAALDALLSRRLTAAAVWLGLGVHTKIYPIIFALPMGLFLNSDFLESPPLSKDEAEAVEEEDDEPPQATNPRQRRSSISSRPKPMHIHVPNQDHKEPRNTALQRLVEFVSWTRVRFALETVGTVTLATALAWLVYGDRCIQDAYLYHFGRTDPRHNFSPYFYALYLALTSTGAGSLSALLFRFAAFVPQLVVIAVAGMKMFRNLPLCMTVQVLAFVSLNKVCTAQYFLWWQSLLPVAAATLNTQWTADGMVVKRDGGSSPWAWLVGGALWLGAQVGWLLQASALEEAGESRFLQVWAAGLVFLGANAALMSCLVYLGRHNPPVASGGKLVAVKEAASGGALAWAESLLLWVA